MNAKEITNTLPEKCFVYVESTDAIGIVRRGESGYIPTGQRPIGVSMREGVDVLNETLGVTKAQAAAMNAGSLFGWNIPAADPANYDSDGRPLKLRKERTMNKIRRKSLQDIAEQLEELKSNLEDIQTEEEEARDNMPESLQGSEKYEKADEAVSNIEEAVSSLDEAISSIEAATE